MPTVPAVGRPAPAGELFTGVVIVVGAAVLAAAGAVSYVSSWNDASRLAMVESLVDHHTFAIDRSSFASADGSRYRGGVLQTGDKLFINGHYYSDKTPVPGVLMAGWYAAWRAVTGTSAGDDSHAFVVAMTIGSSGVSYVVAVWCVYLLAGTVRLAGWDRVALTLSFALATVAPVYSRQVNNHIVLLGVSAALLVVMTRLAARPRAAWGTREWAHVAGIGWLGGLGYTIDQGVGPMLMVCLAGAMAVRYRSPAVLAVFGLAAAPWLGLHHALNYAVGGTFCPANAVPEYFRWPGCVFNSRTMTGAWNHTGAVDFAVYAAQLLVGKRGFLTHQLPLLLAVAGSVSLVRRLPGERPELLFSVAWSVGTVLVYAAGSTNSSGECCSVRWFVPLLAPGFYLLALVLREHPGCRADFLLLSGWSLVLVAFKWHYGPWSVRVGPVYWPAVGLALVSWAAYRGWWSHRPGRAETSVAVVPLRFPAGPAGRPGRVAA